MNTRLSFPVIARLASLQAAFLGLFASSYLLYAYVSHTPIVCGSSSGCEIVRLSQWAYVFGTIPRPLLGVAFYAAVLVLLLVRVALRTYPRALWRLLQVLIVIGVVESAILFFVQWREIGAFCLWCLISAVASLELAFCAFFDKSLEAATPDERSKELRLMVYAMGGLTVVLLAGLWLLLN